MPHELMGGEKFYHQCHMGDSIMITNSECVAKQMSDYIQKGYRRTFGLNVHTGFGNSSVFTGEKRAKTWKHTTRMY